MQISQLGCETTTSPTGAAHPWEACRRQGLRAIRIREGACAEPALARLKRGCVPPAPTPPSPQFEASPT